MALVNFIVPFAQERSNTAGTGPMTLLGPALRRKTFALAGLTTGSKFIGLIELTNADEWEFGRMTLNGSTVERDNPWQGSSGTSPVNFSIGTKVISLVDAAAPVVKPCRVALNNGEATMTIADYELGVNKSVAAATPVTLPPILFIGQRARVSDFKGDAATNNITVSGEGGSTVDGGASRILNVNLQSMKFRAYSLTAWSVIR